MAKMKAPPGARALSFNGETYKVRAGVVDVPEEAVVDLVSHGYEPIADEPADDKDPADDKSGEGDKDKSETDPK